MRRKSYWQSAFCRFLVVLAGLTVLLLVLGLDDGPPPGATVAQTVATAAAAQEYEWAMEVYGDPGCAEYLAREKFEEVTAAWED